MPTELEAAAAAYRAAVAAVDDATGAVHRARAAVPVARTRLAEAIVAAYEHGDRVTAIAAVTGYGREQVRRILRAGGVQPRD